MRLELQMAGNSRLLEALEQLKQILVKSGLYYRIEPISKEENTQNYSTTLRIAYNIQNEQILAFIEANKSLFLKVRLYKEKTTHFKRMTRRKYTKSEEKAENLMNAIKKAKMMAQFKEEEISAFSNSKNSIWETKLEYKARNHIFPSSQQIMTLKEYNNLKAQKTN